MQLWRLSLLFLGLGSLLCTCWAVDIPGIHGKSFFDACDFDKSEVLTVKELQHCTKLMRQEFSIGANPETIVGLLDNDKDGSVSRSEFNQAKKMHGKKDAASGGKFSGTTVDMTDRYGVTRSVPIEQVWALMNQEASSDDNNNPLSHKDNEQGDDSIVRSNNLTEIAQQNPEMAKFIAIGYWIQDRLAELGVEQADGEISQLRTLPTGGSVHRGGEKLSPGNIVLARNFHLWVEMSVKKVRSLSIVKGRKFLYEDNDANKEQTKSNEIMTISFIEIHVEMNPGLYKRPFLHIHEGWLLDRDGNRRLKLKSVKEQTIVSREESDMPLLERMTTTFDYKVVLFIVGSTVLVGVMTLLMFSGLGNRTK